MGENHILKGEWTATKDYALAFGVGLGLSRSRIGECLGVSRNAVIGRCNRLGIHDKTFYSLPRKERARKARPPKIPAPRRTNRIVWPPDAIERIERLRAERRTWDEIAGSFSVSMMTVRNFAKKSGVGGFKNVKHFTDDDKANIRTWWNDFVDTHEIASRLGRSNEVIRQFVHHNGLRRNGELMRAVNKYGRWVLAIDGGWPAIKKHLEVSREEARRVSLSAQLSWERAVLSNMEAKIARGEGRNAAIIEARRAGITLELIGQRIGVTRERIRQICEAAS